MGEFSVKQLDDYLTWQVAAHRQAVANINLVKHIYVNIRHTRESGDAQRIAYCNERGAFRGKSVYSSDPVVRKLGQIEELIYFSSSDWGGCKNVVKTAINNLLADIATRKMTRQEYEHIDSAKQPELLAEWVAADGFRRTRTA